MKTTNKPWFWIIGLFHLIGGFLGYVVYFDIIHLGLRTPTIQLIFTNALIIAGMLLIFEVKSSPIINKVLLAIQIPVFVGYKMVYGMFCVGGFFLVVGQEYTLSVFGTGIELLFGEGPDEFFLAGISTIPIVLLILFNRYLKKLKRTSLFSDHKIGEVPDDDEIIKRKKNLYS